MEKIEGVDLTQLVVESAEELVAEKRKRVGGAIKSLLLAAEQMQMEIRRGKQELQKKEEKLTKTLEKVAKLKAGDWSVLQDAKGGPGTPAIDPSDGNEALKTEA